MPIITLTTDLGTSDHYVSAVKATILRQLDKINIIDIKMIFLHLILFMQHLFLKMYAKNSHLEVFILLV